MAKKTHRRTDEEEIHDSDFSTEECEMYRPTIGTEGELEVDEEAYEFLEYIDLEWPSMTVDTHGSKIILGTFPGQNDGANHRPNIVEVALADEVCDFASAKLSKHPTNRMFNRVRINGAIFGLSSQYLTKLDFKYKVVTEIRGSYRFGLCVTPASVIVGCEDGYVEVYSHDLKLQNRIPSGDAPIECVAFDASTNMIISGSLDNKVRVFSAAGELLFTVDNDSEINALDTRNGLLVFGDDLGKVNMLNLNTRIKDTAEWHCSPISFVRWRDDETFLTGSDEQVCIWDITLADEGEPGVPRNLLFVHQGQHFYKDCAFIKNGIVVTSEDGLCLFDMASFPVDEVA